MLVCCKMDELAHWQSSQQLTNIYKYTHSQKHNIFGLL